MGNGDGSSSAALMTTSCLMLVLVLLLLLLCVSSSSSSSSRRRRRAMAAEYELEEYWSSAATGTFTKDSDGSISLGGACGYGDSYHRGYGQYTTALSSKLFKKGGSCGGCYEVRCVDHILWCLAGSPTVVVTATDFCPPNYGLPGDYGGWCNPPLAHFEMSYSAFVQIAEERSDIIPLQYRRVNCERRGGMRFTLSGGSSFLQALITNVAMDGQVVAVKVKGSKTGWIPMGRNWGQNWQCNVDLKGQPLSFEVSINSGKTLTSYNVAPPDWQFGQTFEGKQFQDK